jgi:ABC-2 type transport system ATP-binding protein
MQKAVSPAFDITLVHTMKSPLQMTGKCQPMLKVRNIHKSFEGIKALDGVDLDVSQGEIVALLGPNGAGKSTLVSVIAGLLKPDRGSVWLNRVDACAHPDRAQRHLGLAPQETGIFPTLSVLDNLRFFGELMGLRRRDLGRRIDEVASSFLLEDLLDRRAQHLSGGEARRLHTAMTVLRRPPLLLLDEITAGVDIQTRNHLLDLIGSLAGQGSAVVYSTHYLHEIERLEADHVTILQSGRVLTSGSIPRLIRNFGGSFVELSFASLPFGLDLPAGTVVVAENVLRVPIEDSPEASAADLVSRLIRSGAALREIKLLEPSLESVFLSVTADAAGNGGAP